jgi:hypothetical protein
MGHEVRAGVLSVGVVSYSRYDTVCKIGGPRHTCKPLRVTDGANINTNSEVFFRSSSSTVRVKKLNMMISMNSNPAGSKANQLCGSDCSSLLRVILSGHSGVGELVNSSAEVIPSLNVQWGYKDVGKVSVCDHEHVMQTILCTFGRS